VEVERPPREIELFQLTVLGAASEQIELETVCSKGTYVRVLAEDIAKALGTCGHVLALRRIYVEPFASEPMETLETVTAARERGGWPEVLPVDWPLTHLPKVSFTGAQVSRLVHGQSVPVAPADAETAQLAGTTRIRLYDEAGQFLGIGEPDGRGNVQPRRLLAL
jgi:tRNA pseudouridine55 synthase